MLLLSLYQLSFSFFSFFFFFLRFLFFFFFFFFFQAEDGIRDVAVTGVQTCALPICLILHAKNAGADAVKLQIFKARRLMHPTAAFAQYQTERCDDRSPAEIDRKSVV